MDIYFHVLGIYFYLMDFYVMGIDLYLMDIYFYGSLHDCITFTKWFVRVYVVLLHVRILDLYDWDIANLQGVTYDWGKI